MQEAATLMGRTGLSATTTPEVLFKETLEIQEIQEILAAATQAPVIAGITAAPAIMAELTATAGIINLLVRKIGFCELF